MEEREDKHLLPASTSLVLWATSVMVTVALGLTCSMAQVSLGFSCFSPLPVQMHGVAVASHSQ